MAVFGAYVLAVAAAVMLLSPLRVSGGPIERQAFTPEVFPRYGILVLALPILTGLALPAFVEASGKARTRKSGPKGAPAAGVGKTSKLRWAIALALLAAAWVGIVGQLRASYVGPAYPNGWSTSWSQEGDYSLSYPGTWESVLTPNWDVAVLDPRFGYAAPAGILVRPLDPSPSGGFSQSVVGSVVRVLSPGVARHWIGELPAGPTLFIDRNLGDPVTTVNLIGLVSHDDRLYELYFVCPVKQFSSFGTATVAEVFRTLYFPS